MIPQLNRMIERELARPHKLDEHRLKGAVLGISAQDHARLTHLFVKARLGPDSFRGLKGEALAARIMEHWRSVTGGDAGPEN